MEYVPRAFSGHVVKDSKKLFGIAPVFRTLSIDGMMISEVCDAKEAIQR